MEKHKLIANTHFLEQEAGKFVLGKKRLRDCINQEVHSEEEKEEVELLSFCYHVG